MATKIPFTNLWVGKQEAKELRPLSSATHRITKDTVVLTRSAESGSYGGDIGWGDPSPGFIPSGGGIGTLYGYNWQFVSRRAEKMAVMNGMFRRLHEIMRDSVCGPGFDASVTCDEEFKGIEKCLNSIIEDNIFGEVNRLDLQIPNFVYESFLFGEMPIMPFVNSDNGDVKWAYIPPRMVRDVFTMSFSNEIISLNLDNGQWNSSKGDVEWEREFGENLRTMRYDTEPYKLDKNGNPVTAIDPNTGMTYKVPNPNQYTIMGDIFHLKVGAVASQVRGQGEGFAIMDMILELEQFQYDFARAFSLQSAVVWHETLTGGTQEEIDSASNELLVTGKQKYVTNEKRTLEMLAPAMKVDDLSNYVRSYMVQIGGALGVPEFMLGDGSQTNVATAREQAPALYQKFTMRQNQLEAFFQMMLRYVIEQKNKRGMIYNEQGQQVILKSKDFKKINIDFAFLPFERNNADTFASSFKMLIDGVTGAMSSDLMSKKLSRNIIQTSISQIGIDVDDDQEIQQIAKEKAMQAPSTATGKPIDASLLPKPAVPKAPPSNAALPKKTDKSLI